MPVDYNATLNLPQTDFPMRASLPQREPDMLSKWEEESLYHKLIEKNTGKPLYILHDGPPYANGDIHLGTALNKVLKDFIVRYKNISGFQSPYVPGWDTHGLPIELKALKSIGVNNVKNQVELRHHCRDFALGYVETQKQQFKRLGVLGDFENPYLTLKPEFEAQQIEVFGEMAKKGYIYKGMKPVYWCPTCVTALAEAEIEYAEDPNYSIYVKFALKDDKGKLKGLSIDLNKTFFVIWTTTTWTLPGNVAICLGADFEYSIIKANGEFYIMATDLVAGAMKAAKILDYETVSVFKGSEFEYMTVQHPFLDRDSLVILGDHVTLESGTGCVHTAPGHGVEDFYVGTQYNLPIVVPVDENGILTKEAGPFEGLSTEKAGKVIAKSLEESGHLFAIEKIIHQYPHCWRCKDPVIFRATEQWFCSVEGFKDEVLKVIKEVEWIPGWGEERMAEMVKGRSDWCISRQRTWGVPIPIFYCTDCKNYIINLETISAVSSLFREKGSDSWYTTEAADILPDGFVCPHCGGHHFTKETDIMDVWFDSGTTHAAVLAQRKDLAWPCDLYLEGNDQYRGWFQSSLLTSVAWKGQAPYKAVCTHGWVVDGEGRKMSKSLGNGIAPEDIIKEFGADILRLWVASSDYHADIRISKDILKQLSEVYRKIRNTARFILSNLSDFDPNKDIVPIDQLNEIDRWALDELNDLILKVQEAYDRFEFHLIYHAVHNFCVVSMSNFYLDILKDRLYVEKANSSSRKSAQSTIYFILSSLTRLLAPILAFTSDEIWKSMPHSTEENIDSVMFNEFPKPMITGTDALFKDKWMKIFEIREDINKSLEIARTNKIIGSSLEAKVTLYCNENELYEYLTAFNDLKDIFIVSELILLKEKGGINEGVTSGLGIKVEKASGLKCERCWSYKESVGSDSNHPTLCERCAAIV